MSRDPYFIQIGFDFGTSYCKCVCRDVMTDKAWVHLPKSPGSSELPFLIPSALQVTDSKLRIGDPSSHYHQRGLPHVKIALKQVACRNYTDPALDPFRKIFRRISDEELEPFVIACGVYLLGCALGEIRKDIRTRYEGFGDHPDDHIAVNLAIPVADAEDGAVNGLFQHVLRRAWLFADRLSNGHPRSLEEIYKHLPGRWDARVDEDESSNHPCFVYPEVSAGVQGFVRSRVSKPGIYLFSDTGAATVDQSVFILVRERKKSDLLAYLYAAVLPLGSSNVERLAAQSNGKPDWKSLEKWRKRKEDGEDAQELRDARFQICGELTAESLTTIYRAKMKLNLHEQLGDIRILFGGGGHSDNPYKHGVLESFKDLRLLGRPWHPPVVGMPIPRDLDLPHAESKWMSRLWVSYGLSFDRGELARFRYPKDIKAPSPEVIWKLRRKTLPFAPSKDDC